MPPHPATDHKPDLSILLDNVRSALNVGSIMRSCEGFGVRHIYFCGITPTPDNPKVGKTALTAEGSIAWSYHLNALDTVYQVKIDAVQIWSLEITPLSIPLEEAIQQQNRPFPILLVAGNEQAGVDPAILAASDCLVYFPMEGIKRSLNIAVAVGTAINLIRSTS